jgi:ABC-2 type transport system permease protein
VQRMLRLTAFLTKELLDIARQPLLLLLLIMGPFFILLLFGAGFTGDQAPVHTIVVDPPDSQLPPMVQQQLQGFGSNYPVTFTSDQQWAMSQLTAGAADIVALVPSDTRDTLLSGQQVAVQLLIDAFSPFRRDYVSYVANIIVADMNRALLRSLVQEILALSQTDQVNPDILSQPIVTTLENISRFKPTYVGFYAPAVVALLVQHIAITFAALSLVRGRVMGTNEFFEVSPLTPAEALAGKFMSYLLLTLAIGLILTLLILKLLDIPLYGDPVLFLLLLILEIGAALGWGFLISAISQQESQAVQFSMILLLSSVFFSGFFLSLSSLLPTVRLVSYALPVTYAIAGFQDVMLAGSPPLPWHLWALAGLTVGLTFVAWLIYRRQFRLG